MCVLRLHICPLCENVQQTLRIEINIFTKKKLNEILFAKYPIELLKNNLTLNYLSM